MAGEQITPTPRRESPPRREPTPRRESPSRLESTRPDPTRPESTRPESTPRREQILRTAARLFAKHGFHGVSIAELGAAVGTSGPALYRHFPGKEALLAEMLIRISERLLAGGQERAGRIDDPGELIAALVDFQLDFTLHEPELITVQDRDLDNLRAAERRRVRALQRSYVEIWVDALCRLHPGLDAEDARIAAHGAFGLLNSTPHSALRADQTRAAVRLRQMALAALTGPQPADV